jgi:hypothetical protein
MTAQEQQAILDDMLGDARVAKGVAYACSLALQNQNAEIKPIVAALEYVSGALHSIEEGLHRISGD